MISLSEELVQISEQGAAAVLATVVEVEPGVRVEPGAKCLVGDGKVSGETIGDPRVIQRIVEESAVRLRAEKSQLVSLNIPEAGGKPVDGRFVVFVVRDAERNGSARIKKDVRGSTAGRHRAGHGCRRP